MTATPQRSVPDWRKIRPPARLAQRPRDPRGFIIPYSVDDESGQPDFRVTNVNRVRELLNTRGCWLCGLAPDYWMCFIGGPLSIRNRLFTDGWMHEACAVYALRVCPFLANPNGRFTTPDDDPRLYQGMAPNRPSEFGCGYTRSYSTALDQNGGLLLHAAAFRKVRWHGDWGQFLRQTRT